MAGNDKDERLFKNILFPTDCAKGSEDAAVYARSLTRQYGARLIVLHVVDNAIEASGFYVPHMSYEKLDEDEESAEARELRKYCIRLFGGVKDCCESIILSGEPHVEILKVAAQKDIDLIVMGSGERSGVDSLFFGSTAKKVLKRSTVPVLIVPPSNSSV